MTGAEILAKTATIEMTDAQRSELVQLFATDAQNYKNIASTNGLSASQKGATTSTLGLSKATKGLSASLKSLVNAHPILTTIALVGTAIFGLVKVYDAINLSAEEAKEKTEDLINAYEDAMNKVNSHKQSVAQISDRYEELSKGVNNLGENVSLTSEEYEEYNSIVNDIVEMFPTMVQGYTNEGNAILKLKGNVDALTEAYKAEEQAAYNALIASGKDSDGNDIIADWKYSLSEDKGKGTNITTAIEELKAFMTSDMDAQVYTTLREQASAGFYDGMTDAEKLIVGSEFLPFKLKIDLDEDGIITDEELGKAKESAKVLLQTYNAEIESDFKNVKTLANAYLMTNEDFKKLDEQSQSAASLLLNSLPAASDIAQVLMTGSKEQVGEYVNFLVQGLSSDNQEVKNALINLLTLDTEDMSPTEIQSVVNSYITTIADYLHRDENELKIQLGFEDVDNVEAKYQNAINKFAESETQALDDLKNKYQEASDKRKELYSGSNYVGNVDINNRPVVINDDGTYSTTSTSFQERQLDDGSYEIIHFTPILPDGTILEGDALNNYLDKILNASDVLEADNPANGGYGLVYKVDTEINGKKITNGNLDNAFGVADAWDVEMHNLQDEMYRDEAEIKTAIEGFGTGSNVDLEKFFADNSINTTEEIDYWNKITEGAHSAEEAVRMYNESKKNPDGITDLLTYDQLEDKIKSFSSSAKDAISSISNLNDAFSEQKEFGQISVDTMMKLAESGYATALQFNATTGACTINAQAMQELVKVKIENQIRDLEILKTDIASRLKEDGVIASNSASGFINLANAKLADIEATKLQQQESIGEFNNAEAQIIALRNALANYDKVASGGYSTSFKSVADSVKDAEKATKEYITSYMDFQKKSLEKGVIDYNTYCNTVSNLLKKMFKEGKIAAEDYHGYTKEMLESQQDVMDAVVSAVTYRIDEEIERIESEKDAIQSTIDALREENDEKERAIALEEARYKLQQSYAQRTTKLYTGSKGVTYDVNHDEIRNAQDELSNLEFEEVIHGLEKEQEALDSSIEELERYKDEWNDISKEHERTQNEMLAQSILGADWESQILSGRIDVLNTFADTYFRIQQAIVDAAWQSANEQNRALNSIGSGSTDGSGSIQTYEVIYEGNAETVKTFDNQDDAKKYADAMSKGIDENEPSYYVKKVKTYHNGLEGGYVGDKTPLSSDKRLKLLQSAGRGELLSDEVPAILQKGELVLTKGQQINLADTIRQNLVPIDYTKMFNTSIPDYSYLKDVVKNNNPTVTLSIGDIHLHDVPNVDVLGQQIVKRLPNVMLQAINKR